MAMAVCRMRELARLADADLWESEPRSPSSIGADDEVSAVVARLVQSMSEYGGAVKQMCDQGVELGSIARITDLDVEELCLVLAYAD
ncbi:MAG: hypothetical protein JWM76_4314 [Pseudonocardiales bacterium]|nr:hypothetical protein [Pseudonocardiales bacterium]